MSRILSAFCLIYRSSVNRIGGMVGWMEGRQMKRHKIRKLALLLLVGVLLLARPGGAEEIQEKRSLTNLKGEVVTVPGDVPDKQAFSLLGMQSITAETPAGKHGVILIIYNNPKSQGMGNYVETYNFAGDLLEITWSDEGGQVRVAQDKNLTDPDAKEL
ncbi:MAG: hypothetical protein M5R38_01055 [Candidatus Methylomirabilis sp.]|nr:hypothetical protein [Candidatus Methylomirabilis sp.]